MKFHRPYFPCCRPRSGFSWRILLLKTEGQLRNSSYCAQRVQHKRTVHQADPEFSLGRLRSYARICYIFCTDDVTVSFFQFVFVSLLVLVSSTICPALWYPYLIYFHQKWLIHRPPLQSGFFWVAKKYSINCTVLYCSIHRFISLQSQELANFGKRCWICRWSNRTFILVRYFSILWTKRL